MKKKAKSEEKPKKSTKKTMKISEFKAKCLKVVEHLPEEGLLLTKHGEPIAKIIPLYHSSPGKRFLGCLKDDLEIKGDIFSTGVTWDANKK